VPQKVELGEFITLGDNKRVRPMPEIMGIKIFDTHASGWVRVGQLYFKIPYLKRKKNWVGMG